MVNYVIGGLFFLMALSGAGCTGNEGRNEQMVDLSAVKDDPETDLANLNAAIKGSKRNANLYARRAVLYLKQDAYDKALTDAEEALKLSKNNPEYLFLKAQALRSLKREGEALKIALLAERNGYQNAALYVLLSDLYVQLRQYEKARQYNNLAYKLAPNDEFVLYYRGRIAAATGDTTSAISNYKNAIRQAPKFFEPVRELGGVYVVGRDFEQAQPYLDQALKQQPSDGLTWYYQGKLFQATERTDSAVWSYRNALKAADSLMLAHHQLGYIYFSRGDYSRAVSHLGKVSGQQSNAVRYLTTLARSYEKLGQYQQALEQYEKLVKLEPKYSYAHRNIARLRSRLTVMKPDSAAIQEFELE